MNAALFLLTVTLTAAPAPPLHAAVDAIDAFTFDAGAPQLLTEAIPNRGERVWLKLAVGCSAGAQAFDLGSTLAAVRLEGYREANPVLSRIAKNPAKLAALKGGVLVGSTVAFVKAGKRRPKLAAALASATCLGIGYVAHQNLEKIRRGR